MDVITYALLNKRLKGVASGIKNIELGSNQKSLVFTTNNNTKITVNMPTIDLVYVGDTAPDPKKYELWVDTSAAGSVGGGSATLTQDLTSTEKIGSVTVGKTYPAGTDLETIIRNILISYIKPTMTIGINPTTTLYDIETQSLSSLKITANVTKKSEDIEYVRYYVDGSLVNTLTTDVANGGIFSYTHSFTDPIAKTFIVKTECRDITSHSVVSAQTTITFVPKTYYGVIEDGNALNEANVKALSNELRKSVGSTHGFTATYGRFVYAVPKSIGNVTTAKDLVNNFNYTDSITKTTIQINGIDYNLIYLTDAAGFDDLSITFA